jgi:hypothetical protein
MGDPDPSSDRLTRAGGRHRRYLPSAISGPGIRVIELHVLGIQVQLLSINMGRRWPPLSSYRSPANATHWRADWTITVERRRRFANRCGRTDPIKSNQLLLLVLSEALECLRRTMQRGVMASSMVARWKCRTSHRSVQRPAEAGT